MGPGRARGAGAAVGPPRPRPGPAASASAGASADLHHPSHQPPAAGPATGDREWIRWPDFWVPTNFNHAAAILRSGYDRAITERVEVACGGGVGRTGTALAALAMFDGLPESDAVDWVRRCYHPRAVEVPWQRRFLRFLTTDQPRT